MYSSLYRPHITSILDNRKFINPNSLVYEAPPKVNKYIPDETLEEKINYSYGPNLKDTGATDVYQYRYNANYTGQRDESTGGIWSKLDTENRPIDPENPIQYNRFGKEKLSSDKNQIKESFLSPNNKPKSTEQPNKSTPQPSCSQGSCSAGGDGQKSICGDLSSQLFHIMDPRFNLREAAKNMILLEDHLFQMGKRCQDCILKHCLTIEGFLEEGLTLDVNYEYIEQLKKSFDDFREIFKEIAEKKNNGSLINEDCFKIAQKIRQVRKPLCQNFATFL